tara:strand:+ start:948 stop:1340 length:393 start_codon:yes stop_codon:yes gene_type:complete
MKKLLIILLLPNLLFSQFYEEYDKQLHFAAGSIIGATGYVWSYQKHQDKKRAMITGICLAFAAGVVKELYDGEIENGYVELEDIAATTLGGITWSVSIPLFQPTRKSTKIRPNKKKRRPKSNRKCWKSKG